MADETDMTKALIDELTNVMKQGRYLLLTGGTGVGKTYIAKKIAQELIGEGWEDRTTVVPIHRTYGYSDFVTGISFNAEKRGFEHLDKIFLTELEKARKSNEKHVLILDDIGRGMITGILGDVLSLIEPHGNSDISIPPNFYIIATRSTLTDSIEPAGYGFSRRFYHRHIEADYGYMSEKADKKKINDCLSANDMFYKTNKIIADNLRYKANLTGQETEKYFIGHGVFNDRSTLYTMKHQVIPLLRQYVKEGVLDKSGVESEIGELEYKLNDSYIKSETTLHGDITIELPTKDAIDSNYFKRNKTTSQPIVNLFFRIKQQGLLSDVDIWHEINSSYVWNYGTNYIPVNGARLFAKDTIGRTFKEISKEDTYDDKLEITINNKNNIYVPVKRVLGHYWTSWNKLTEDKDYICEHPHQNKMLYRMLKKYYDCIHTLCQGYLKEITYDDLDIRKQNDIAVKEWNEFCDFYEKNLPKGNLKGKSEVEKHCDRLIKYIAENLTLLWTNIGEEILDTEGKPLTLKGVYKVDTKDKIKEFQTAMDTLGINQMIMQGPPGTSKTYSAKEFLRYVGELPADDDAEGGLKSCQITDYKNWEPKDRKIAWDIVQFHPSYGYEDFVRGIEVSTEAKEKGISYNTVDKILGKMAKLARKNKEVKFYLIIDEINRANLATVFGELIYGLEYRGESVATPYTVKLDEKTEDEKAKDSNQIMLPKNLYIIGTMNTADKSIGGIDYAIRRRFLFFSLLPDENVIKYYNNPDNSGTQEQKKINAKAATLFNKIAELFEYNLSNEYYKEDVQIGHTYFLIDAEKDDPVKKLEMRFTHQIVPILREYCKDGLFSNLDTGDRSDRLRSFKLLIKNEKDVSDENGAEVAVDADEGFKDLMPTDEEVTAKLKEWEDKEKENNT